MSTCTFLGHRQCPPDLRPQLRRVLMDFIEEHGVRTFYVGNQVGFERMACSVLRELCLEYPSVTYGVVLAHLPIHGQEKRENAMDDSHLILPDGIDTIPKQFAMDWRNRWMLKQSDYVVTYVTHPCGHAARYAALAKQMGKRVLNLDPPRSVSPYIGRL